ncbi:unnamed protein product [Cuscuta campestris]|uniref:Late embryogenesis abundant protein LEA-2 subgroup domain-containing protein n=1 Tax=Cuscuta campestris TaxID=132261 RepID=A0A484L556_9ASTE|nr:unnamed protein product [Cuscuta campestris]
MGSGRPLIKSAFPVIRAPGFSLPCPIKLGLPSLTDRRLLPALMPLLLRHPNYSFRINLPYRQPDPDEARRRRSIIAELVFCGAVSAFTIAFLAFCYRRYPDFRADSLSVSDFNISSSNLVAGNWDLRFTVRNPNGRKTVINYEHIRAEIFYGKVPLAETVLKPFSQEPKNETSLEARFFANGTFVDDWIVERLNEDMEFNVRFYASVSLKAGWQRSEEQDFTVYCKNLKVTVDGGGSHGSSDSGGPKRCAFRIPGSSYERLGICNY